jgi:class 3 adenylate cyclase
MRNIVAFNKEMVDLSKFSNGGTISDSVVVFIDIQNFTKRTAGMTLLQIKDYLENFYAFVLPEIQKQGGQVDRIMGDGILIVFSEILNRQLLGMDIHKISWIFSKRIVEKSYATKFPLKACLASGPLSFCEIGVEGVFHDFTILGMPITEAYRLDEVARKGHVLTYCDSPLARQIPEEGNEVWNVIGSVPFSPQGLGPRNYVGEVLSIAQSEEIRGIIASMR